MIIRAHRDGLIVLSDAGDVHTYTVAFEPGDLTISIPDTNGSRFHDDEPCELRFSTQLRNVSGEDFATILDIAHRYDGGHVATEWASTSAGDVFTVNCSVVFSGAEMGEADERLDFARCVVRASIIKSDTVNVTITSYVAKPVRI